MFECTNRALQLKDSITRFSENHMELDGWIDEKVDEDTSDGKLANWRGTGAHNAYPFFVVTLYIFSSEVCVFLPFAIVHIIRV